eukprot:scaffold14354_cov56-Attheya_sp.AAC.2
MAYRTIEFNRKVAFNGMRKEATHYILPDLPSAITPQLRELFYKTVPTNQRIITIAACRHTASTLKKEIDQLDTNRILLVGGNEKQDASLSSEQALTIIREHSNLIPWCVWDPNSVDSQNRLLDKQQAGAMGVVTQPLFTTRAWNNIQTVDINMECITGVPLISSRKNFMFWLDLLEGDTESFISDPVLCHSLDYFHEPMTKQNAPLLYATNYLEQLLSLEVVQGVHFMPMNNTKVLNNILTDNF